jgi:branched-chain amino acid aminotransferase
MLPGITRAKVLTIAKQLKIPVRFALPKKSDLLLADEVFLTYTSGEIVPVNSADSRRIGRECPGTVTQMLSAAYKDAVAEYVGKVKGKGKGKSREKRGGRSSNFCES